MEKNKQHLERQFVRLIEKDPRWERLSEDLFTLIEGLVKSVSKNSDSNEGRKVSSAEAAFSIASDWAKAKVDKPILETEKLKAEIRRIHSEAETNEAQAEATRLENSLKKLEFAIKSLEYAEKVTLVREKQGGAKFTLADYSDPED